LFAVKKGQRGIVQDLAVVGRPWVRQGHTPADVVGKVKRSDNTTTEEQAEQGTAEKAGGRTFADTT